MKCCGVATFELIKHKHMKTIIAPTNFTATSLHAVNYAADMAVNIDADLILLHVIQIPTAFDVPATQYEYDSMLEDAEHELDGLKKELLIRTGGNINISTRAVFSTLVFEMAEIEKETKPYIIVVGPEREGAVNRLLFGSHTFQIARHLPCPVVVVPENALFRHIKRIGLATDLKDITDIPLETLRDMVELFDAELDIIHVCRSADEKFECEKGIAAIKDRLKDFEPRFHFEMNDDVEKGINAYAARNMEDLIVVLPKKHGLLSSLFYSSRSKKIAQHPAVPVVAITA